MWLLFGRRSNAVFRWSIAVGRRLTCLIVLMAVRRSVHKWRENCPRKDGRKSVIIRNGRTNERQRQLTVTAVRAQSQWPWRSTVQSNGKAATGTCRSNLPPIAFQRGNKILVLSVSRLMIGLVGCKLYCLFRSLFSTTSTSLSTHLDTRRVHHDTDTSTNTGRRQIASKRASHHAIGSMVSAHLAPVDAKATVGRLGNKRHLFAQIKVSFRLLVAASDFN